MRKTTKEAIYERLRVKRTNVKFEYGSSFTFIHGLNLFKRAKPTENYLHRRLKLRESGGLLYQGFLLTFTHVICPLKSSL